MTSLIYTGTLFSGWQHIVGKQVQATSAHLSVCEELSALSAKICSEHFQDTDELLFKPFSPDEHHITSATKLFSSVQNDPVFAWANENISLLLGFWQTTADNAKFILFYSSPEHELSNYISNHPFDAVVIEKIISSWVFRTQAMLNFFLNNRNDCLLVNIQSVQIDRKAFDRTMSERFDLNIETDLSGVGERVEHSVFVECLATTLLKNNETASEIYDEVRSTATILSEGDKAIPNIQDRNKSLITAFLNEVTGYRNLAQSHKELESELSLYQLQINQLQEELEFYFNSSQEQQKNVHTFADYLSKDPMLKVARLARLSQS